MASHLGADVVGKELTPFPDSELRRIASFHLWEAAKRVASVANRAEDPVLRGELGGVCSWLQQAHERLREGGVVGAPATGEARKAT